MTHRLTSAAFAFGLIALLLFITLVHSVSRADALASDGHGPGYLSSDGWWLGAYTLDDRTQGFCLHAGRQSPVGHGMTVVEGQTLDWFTPEQSAKLAYISRTWAATGDRRTAAAGQLATWMVAGLNGKTAEYYAARAGSDAGFVLDRAHGMVAEADREGSRSVAATVTLELSESGPGRARVELLVDRLSGTAVVEPRAYSGQVQLTGAVFDDGSTSATAANGTDIAITPTGTAETVSVTATATFGELPYGDRLRVAVGSDDVQALLVAVPATADATAEVEEAGVSPLPFGPVISTVTSAAATTSGSAVSDNLTIALDPADGLLAAWGVWESADGLRPVEAVVESSLLGPFDGEIVPADAAPVGAPVVCTVETIVSGPGEYQTPECTIVEAGTYVWVEKIDPARTPVEQGGARLRPWQSTFGVPSEVTVATDAVAPAELAATGSDAASAGAVAAGVAAAGVLAAGAALCTVSRRCRAARLRALAGTAAIATADVGGVSPEGAA